MPVLGAVSPLVRDDLNSAGDYLNAVRDGSCEQAGLLAVAVTAGGEVAADPALDEALVVPAREIVASAQLTGKAGQIAQAVARSARGTLTVAFVGVGDRSPAELRRAGGELGRSLRPGATAVVTAVAAQPADQAGALAEGLMLGCYRYSEKSATTDVCDAQVRMLVSEDCLPALAQAEVFASAVALARDLSNTPSVRKSPQWLADEATRVAAESGLTIRIWTESELASAGFGGICAVGSGSERPPRLIELRYIPPMSAQPGPHRHVALIGKGITFDSGGLSLKPNEGMRWMKTDMAGGAAVIAVMSALARLGVSCQVTGLIAAAENMPSGSAYRPGDVITAYGGRTTEVLNTDAEGRLVLADAIAYADAELAPDQIVDLATLTGAARIALGGSRAALYATSEQLAAGLLEAGETSGERLWRMPLTAQYRTALDSPVADLANISRGDEGAGSILAALFLREFAGARPWAHLDIAGAARSAADDGESSAGATGFGTRLLLRWLLSR